MHNLNMAQGIYNYGSIISTNLTFFQIQHVPSLVHACFSAHNLQYVGIFRLNVCYIVLTKVHEVLTPGPNLQSASERMMLGLFPPSSKVTFFRLLRAAICGINWPIWNKKTNSVTLIFCDFYFK